MPADGFVILTMAFRQDGRRWTGECLELGTATYARTLKQASDELHELVTLHLNALDDVGECDRFFREHGIRYYSDAVMPDDAAPRIPTDGDAFFQARRIPVGGLSGASA
jgi:hypothetical protein